jgi:putative ABC transport system permease protein
LLPHFNDLSGKELSRAILFRSGTLAALLILSILITIAAGSYPALVLSGSKVMRVLKSGFNFTGAGGLRKALIVFQFVISIFLIISTIIILQQLRYIHHKDLGYDKEQVMVLPVDNQMLQHYDDLKKAVAAVPGVLSVSAAYESPTNIQWGDGIHKGTTENEKEISVNAIPVDEDFIKTLGIKIIAGSDYTLTDVLQMDTSHESANLRYTFMLNETAAKALGWKPEEAVGKTITKGHDGIVKAVVKDFHFHSLHEPITPLVIFLDKRMLYSMFVKVKGEQMASVIGNLETTWKERVATRPFEYHFLDEDYDALYQSEQRTASVFTVFSMLAIVLACLGLFALTAYAMVKRTKEIGIRKVLGAGLADILALVSKDFLKLIFIALLIAAPLAFYAISKWLQNFSYKVQISWWVFITGGLATMIIALITISLQAIKTALANPVKSLKAE